MAAEDGTAAGATETTGTATAVGDITRAEEGTGMTGTATEGVAGAAVGEAGVGEAGVGEAGMEGVAGEAATAAAAAGEIVEISDVITKHNVT